MANRIFQPTLRSLTFAGVQAGFRRHEAFAAACFHPKMPEKISRIASKTAIRPSRRAPNIPETTSRIPSPLRSTGVATPAVAHTSAATAASWNPAMKTYSPATTSTIAHTALSALTIPDLCFLLIIRSNGLQLADYRKTPNAMLSRSGRQARASKETFPASASTYSQISLPRADFTESRSIHSGSVSNGSDSTP